MTMVSEPSPNWGALLIVALMDVSVLEFPAPFNVA